MADLVLNDAVLVEVATARRRGLKKAAQAVLAVSDANAPREDVPRHGVHMTETGFVRIEPGPDTDTAAIGYEAFWAVWQEEDLTYHHERGHAKFLSGALLEAGQAAVDEFVAAEIRSVLG